MHSYTSYQEYYSMEPAVNIGSFYGTPMAEWIRVRLIEDGKGIVQYLHSKVSIFEVSASKLEPVPCIG